MLTLCPALAPLLFHLQILETLWVLGLPLMVHLQILETLWVLGPLWPSLGLQLLSSLVSLPATQLIYSRK